MLAGIGLAKYGEISGLPLVGAPWIVPVVLAILGLVVLYMALQIHKYTSTDPEKRVAVETVDPQKAFAHWCHARRWVLPERRWPVGTEGSSS